MRACLTLSAWRYRRCTRWTCAAVYCDILLQYSPREASVWEPLLAVTTARSAASWSTRLRRRARSRGGRGAEAGGQAAASRIPRTRGGPAAAACAPAPPSPV